MLNQDPTLGFSHLDDSVGASVYAINLMSPQTTWCRNQEQDAPSPPGLGDRSQVEQGRGLPLSPTTGKGGALVLSVYYLQKRECIGKCHCCDKIPNEGNLRKEGLFWLTIPGCIPPRWADHMVSTFRKNRAMSPGVLLAFFLTQSRTLPPVLATFRIDLLFSVKPFWRPSCGV